MDEQFDNELKKRIKLMFDDFEHQAVDKGWSRLQDKLPVAGRNAGMNRFWAVAAAVAILLVFFLFNKVVWHQESETKRLSTKMVNHSAHEKATVQNKQGIDSINSSGRNAVDKGAISDLTSMTPDKKMAQKNQPAQTQPQWPDGEHTAIVVKRAIKNKPATNQTFNADEQNFSSLPNKEGDVAIIPALYIIENLMPVNYFDTAKIISKDKIGVPLVANNDVLTGNQLLTASQNTTAKPSKPAEKNKKKITFSAYASTYLSYASGSSNMLNAGAGVTADIRLFRNLELASGLAVEQNTLNYGNQLPNLNSVVNTGAAFSFNFIRQNSGATSGVAYSMVLKNYTARLVGLDIPLNLKYNFNSESVGRYVAVGVSSGAFIHQSYTYQYNYSSQSVQLSATDAKLSSFYFAKTLNVAVGMSYPIGKTNHLTIEPFLKYPLGGLGDEGIRFGAGGINLKFGLSSSKK